MRFIDEFKEFISKGNVIDMSVGIVVGSAFTAIVNSLVSDIITPSIALLTKLFQSGAREVSGIAGDGAQEAVNSLLSMENWIIPGTEIKVGSFIQSIISFLIMAFVIFCVVKCINTMRARFEKQKEETADEEKTPTVEETTAEIKLLEEIRDALVK